MTKTMKACDRCGGEHEVFAGEQAVDLATFRSPDGKTFVSHYGSDFDGDVMEIIAEVPEAQKALCDGCVRTLLDAGTLRCVSNYLDDWAGEPQGLEIGALDSKNWVEIT